MFSLKTSKQNEMEMYLYDFQCLVLSEAIYFQTSYLYFEMSATPVVISYWCYVFSNISIIKNN